METKHPAHQNAYGIFWLKKKRKTEEKIKTQDTRGYFNG